MRLLLVNYEYPPLGAGAGNATAEIAKNMALDGHEVLVITSGMRRLELWGEETRNGYHIIRIPTLRKNIEKCSPYEMAIFLMSGLWHCRHIARSFRPDATLVFFGLPCGPIGRFLKSVTNTPYILSLRGGDIPEIPYGPVRYYHKLAAPLNMTTWRHASAIVVTSNSFQRLAQTFANRVRRTVQRIPNGIDCDRFYPADKTSQAKPVRVLYVGRVVPEHKGLESLIPAFQMVSRKYTDGVTLEIVGDGGFRSDLERLVDSLGVSDLVTFSGWIDRGALLKSYQSADIFVLPSIGDGMTNSILEAMACGLPIVTTSTSAEHLVEDGINGILVPPKESDPIRDAIGRLVADDGLRRRMGRESRTRALGMSWQSVARQYLDLAGVACA